MRKNKRRKKRAVTLIEIMIVILLIGLIGGALAFNMRGSMDKGKEFKTEQNCARVYDALMIAYAAGEFNLEDYDNLAKVQQVLENSPMIKDATKTLKDGWGVNLIIQHENGDLLVFSQKARDLENARKGQ